MADVDILKIIFITTFVLITKDATQFIPSSSFPDEHQIAFECFKKLMTSILFFWTMSIALDAIDISLGLLEYISVISAVFLDFIEPLKLSKKLIIFSLSIKIIYNYFLI